MRISCPNCGAIYEVPDDVIPAEGRDVQCSNCGDTWFQESHDHPQAAAPRPGEAAAPERADRAGDGAVSPQKAAPPPEAEAEPEAEPSADAARAADPDASETTAPDADRAAGARRRIAPDVAEVLREEAERERRVRATEADAGIETQTEMGLDTAMKKSRQKQEGSDRLRRLRGEDDDAAATGGDRDHPVGGSDGAGGPSDPGGAGAPHATPDPEIMDPGTRRNLLPDIEEINSSLGDGRFPRDRATTVDGTVGPEADSTSRSSGFGRGFRRTVALFVVGWIVYLVAPQLSETVPALESALDTYVAAVNQARGWADWAARVLMRLALDLAGPALRG